MHLLIYIMENCVDIGKNLNYSFHIVYIRTCECSTVQLYTVWLFAKSTGSKQSSYPSGFFLKVKICSEPILTVCLRVPTVLEIGEEDTHFVPSSTTA